MKPLWLCELLGQGWAHKEKGSSQCENEMNKDSFKVFFFLEVYSVTNFPPDSQLLPSTLCIHPMYAYILCMHPMYAYIL